MKSANLELVNAYFAKLEKDGFFGTVEVTLQGGKFAHAREYKSVQDFEVAASSWESLPKEAQTQLLAKFGANAKFKEAMTKNAPVLGAPKKIAG